MSSRKRSLEQDTSDLSINPRPRPPTNNIIQTADIPLPNSNQPPQDASTWYDTLRTLINDIEILKSGLERLGAAAPTSNVFFSPDGKTLFEYHAYSVITAPYVNQDIFSYEAALELKNRVIAHLFGTWDCLALMDRDYWQSQTLSLLQSQNAAQVLTHLDLSGRLTRHPLTASQNVEMWKNPIVQFFHGGPVPEEEYQDLSITVNKILRNVLRLVSENVICAPVWQAEKTIIDNQLMRVSRQGGEDVLDKVEAISRPLVVGGKIRELAQVSEARLFPFGRN